MSANYTKCHVIAGFPGIGKTTVAKKFEESKNSNFIFLDFDSAVFKHNVNYADLKEFNINTGKFETVSSEHYAYVKAIKDIMDGYERGAKDNDKAPKLFIMCSTHTEVRRLLDKFEIPHTIVIPGGSITAYRTYVNRLTARYEASLETDDVALQEANKRALDAVEKNYYKFIAEIKDNPISKYAQLVVLADNETLSDYVHSTVTGSVLSCMFNAVGIPHVTNHDVQKALLERDDALHTTMGQHGEVIFWSDPVPGDIIDMPEVNAIVYSLNKILGKQSVNSAFAGCPYVMISKETAQGVIDCCNLAISKLESGAREDNDVEVFGDLALHYERLIDAVDGFSYLHWHAKRQKEEAAKKNKEDKANLKIVGKDGSLGIVNKKSSIDPSTIYTAKDTNEYKSEQS